MKIAFDFDGTITAHPVLLNLLAWALHGAGHEVIVLTAAAGELPKDKRPAEVTQRLRKYGFFCPHTLACVEGMEKGLWCKEHNVDVVIDDDDAYLWTIREHSPKTLRLQVV